MSQFTPITGLVAAPHTPFGDDGSVCFETIDVQIKRLSTDGLAGVFVNGTTGEGLSLTSGERMQILDTWIGNAPGEYRVIAHVGHHSVHEAAQLSAHAAGAGAWGVSTMAPSFLKPGSVADLVAFCKPIAAAAPDLPFYFYHIPSLSGVSLPMPEFLQLGSEQIPNLAGIKFTHGDLFEYQRCLAIDQGRFDILWGVDESLLGALAVGAQGAVGSTYNYAASNYIEMINAFGIGDRVSAMEFSANAVALVELLIEFGVLAAGKAIMSLRGVECGPPRAPIAGIDPRRRSELLAKAEALGIVDA